MSSALRASSVSTLAPVFAKPGRGLSFGGFAGVVGGAGVAGVVDGAGVVGGVLSGVEGSVGVSGVVGLSLIHI